MRTSACVTAIVAVLAVGAVSVRAQTGTIVAPAPPATQVYSGEVWTWDETTNVVTLRQGEGTVRVRVTPEELRRLQLHQAATVRGELAPPEQLPRVAVDAAPMNAEPRGTAQQTEVSGTVTAATPDGRLSISTDRGALHVWAAAGVDKRLAPGTLVRIVTSVQPVEYVPASSAPKPAAEPSASVAPRPGDYSVVTGRVLGVNPRSLLVESPAGPIQVAVADASAFTVSPPVQVRTTVSTAQ